MARVLIVYATTEGRARLVADHLAERVRAGGQRVDVIDAAALPPGFLADGYHGALVCASIHYGRHQRAIRDFVRRYRSFLDAVPSAFISVSLSARRPDMERYRQELRRHLDDFHRDTGWRPGLETNVAGALVYSRYGPFKRRLLQLLMWFSGGPTDPSRDYEFTNWENVDRFAESFLGALSTPAARRANE